MAESVMREILLHGGPDEAFDRSVIFARRMAESFGARLHVLYTVEEPLSAGWTAEMSAERGRTQVHHERGDRDAEDDQPPRVARGEPERDALRLVAELREEDQAKR